jgi:hypothetical protein
MRFNRGTAVSLAILAMALAGCGTAGTSAGTSPTPSDQAVLKRALAAWADFPVNASPRPLVLPDGTDQIVASATFGVSTNDQKLAFGEGAIDPPPTLPSTPTKADGYQLITAGQAFRELSAGNGQSLTTTRIQTSSVTLGMAGLDTWVFTFGGGVTGSQAVLAVASSSTYPIPAPLIAQSRLSTFSQAELGSDGRTLTVDTGGAPSGSGPCDARYSLQVASSDTAVAIGVDVQPNPAPSEQACPQVAELFQFTTVLSSPLGARVVINVEAQPVSVAESS